MNKSCPYCGKTHHIAFDCPAKPKREHKRNPQIAAFRNSRVWKRKSHEIMERDHYLCQECLKHNILTSDNLSVHHIVPLSVDFEKRLDNDNLVTLCRKCHR